MCAMYGRDIVVAVAAAAELGIAHKKHGVKAASIPVGSDEFATVFLQETI
jgi:hypothetical protein